MNKPKNYKNNNSPIEMLGFLPPQDVDVERSVLGMCIAIENSYKSIHGLITSEMFYRDDNKSIFQAIENLFADGEPIDLITVKNELRKMEKLEQVGGAITLSKLSRSILSAANLKSHALIIHEKFLKRKMIEYNYQKMQRTMETDFDLFEELHKQSEEQNELINLINQNRQSKNFMQALSECHQDYNNRKKKTTKDYRIGIEKIDNVLKFEENNLIIIAARPGMGKTAFALHITKQYSKRNMKGLFLSLEMTTNQLLSRVICAEADIRNNDFRHGNLSEMEEKKLLKTIENISDWQLTIDDESYLNITGIEARLIAAKEKGIDYCIIDYLGLIALPQKGTRNDELGEVSRMLKILAKKINIPIIALHQLSRKVEERRCKIPMLSDLRDSGNIEQDADIVIFLHREDYYSADKTNIIDIITAKYREGSTGQTQLKTNSSLTKFEELETVDIGDLV
jgi:replicative DNA helicase